MIDINRLIGLVFYSDSPQKFRAIRGALLSSLPALEIDDAALVLGKFCEGIGPITAGVANSLPLDNEEHFIRELKCTVREVGLVDIDEPKVVMVISDRYSPLLQRNLQKMQSMILTSGYNIDLIAIQLSEGTATEGEVPRIFVDTPEELQREVQEILGEYDGYV